MKVMGYTLFTRALATIQINVSFISMCTTVAMVTNQKLDFNYQFRTHNDPTTKGTAGDMAA
jgi:hypothetical protein